MPVRAVPNVHRLTLALLAALALPAMAQQAGTTETDASGKIKNLDQVTVTGSRIKRTDVETALPVAIIRRQRSMPKASPRPSNCCNS